MGNEVKSAGRVLELIELLARASEPLSLSEVVSELSYPKSSAFGLLQTLVARGYVVREEPERYRLHEACRSGPGWTSGRDAHLVGLAQPLLRDLRDEIGETVFLGVRAQRGRVRVIAKAVSTQAIRYDSNMSGSIPSYCSAIGRVMLAYWDPRLVDEYLGSERLVRHTSKTVIDRLEIRRIIAAVPGDGYAISDEEVEVGGSGVAAPVFGPGGTLVAALNVATPTPRFALGRDAIVAAMLRKARLLSQRSGFVPAAGRTDARGAEGEG